MNMTASPSIVAAERMEDGIFIEFDDGKSAFYSAPLLYTCLPQAVAVNVSDPEDDVESED